MDSDRQLIRDVLAATPGADDRFAARYRPWVVGLAVKRYGLSPSAAEDVFQNVIVRLWEQDFRALRAWRGEGRFSTYLSVIAGRLCLEARRSTGRTTAREAPLEDLDAEIASTEEAATLPAEIDADQSLIDSARRRAVHRALEELAPRDRLMLQMQLRDERTPTEVAAVVGLRPATARKALHDARARLRRILLRDHGELFSDEARP